MSNEQRMVDAALVHAQQSSKRRGQKMRAQ
jgi:hypothetical protein